MGFKLREGHFDRVQVRRISGQKQEPGAPFSQGCCCPWAFMRVEIVKDDDVALVQGRGELCLDVSIEGLAIHGAVDDPWRNQAVAPQSRDEGLRKPFAERRLPAQSLASKAAPSKPAHIGLYRGFVEEDEPARLLAHGGLAMTAPVTPRGLHVAAFLFAGQKCFFYR